MKQNLKINQNKKSIELTLNTIIIFIIMIIVLILITLYFVKNYSFNANFIMQTNKNILKTH